MVEFYRRHLERCWSQMRFYSYTYQRRSNFHSIKQANTCRTFSPIKGNSLTFPNEIPKYFLRISILWFYDLPITQKGWTNHASEGAFKLVVERTRIVLQPYRCSVRCFKFSFDLRGEDLVLRKHFLVDTQVGCLLRWYCCLEKCSHRHLSWPLSHLA